ANVRMFTMFAVVTRRAIRSFPRVRAERADDMKEPPRSIGTVAYSGSCRTGKSAAGTARNPRSGDHAGGTQLGLFGQRFVEPGELLMDHCHFGLGRVGRGLMLLDRSSP